MVSKDLLAILACPKCKGKVKVVKAKIICENCRLRFSIIDKDIPNMLIDEAESY